MMTAELDELQRMQREIDQMVFKLTKEEVNKIQAIKKFLETELNK